MPSITQLLRIKSAALLAFAVCMYLILPSLPRWNWISSTTVARMMPVGIFLCLFGSALSWVLSVVFDAPAGKASAKKTPPKFETLPLTVVIAGSVLVLALTVFALKTNPLTWDENTIGSAVSERSWQQMPALILEGSHGSTSTLHPIAMLTTLASFKLFGIHELTPRWPSLFFTLLFLGILGWLARTRLSRFAAVCVYTHLAASALALWYLASARGYVSMMAFGLLPLLILMLVTEDKKAPPRHYLALYTGGAVLTSLCNANGGMYCFLLMVGLAFWTYLHRSELDAPRWKRVRNLLYASVAVLPLAVVGNAAEIVVQGDAGHFSQAGTGTLQVLGFLLGQSWGLAARVTVLITVAFAVLRLRTGKADDFLTVLLAVALVFYGALIVLMQTSAFQARYILAFLVPYVIWLARSAEGISDRTPRQIVQTLLLAVLVVVPAMSQKTFRESEAGGKQDFAAFIREVRSHAQGGCVVVHGENSEALWARRLYFASCADENAWIASFDPIDRVPADERWHAVLQDRGGRALYQRKGTP